MKIGFFDSGLGGLIILKAVAKALPQYDYLYYGDTKNLPYGDKTESEIFAMTKAGVGELFSRDCALVIIACNTASSETLRRLQDEYLPTTYPNRRILGVIIPTIEEVIDNDGESVLLVATSRTVNSKKYELELDKRVGENRKLYSLATPGLVPLIESGQTEEALKAIVVAISSELDKHPDIKTVILGCTHYTLLKDELRARFPGLKFISQDEVIPPKLETYLAVHKEITEKLSSTMTRDIILTEHRPDYDQLISEFLNGTFVAS